MKNIEKNRQEQGYRQLNIQKSDYQRLYPLERIKSDEKLYIFVNPFNKQVEVDIRSNLWGVIKNKVLKKPLKNKKKYLWDRKDYDKLLKAERETKAYKFYKRRFLKEANINGVESNITISCRCGNTVLEGEPLDLFERLTGDGWREKEKIKSCIVLYCKECEHDVNFEGLEEGSKDVINKLLDFFLNQAI